MLPKRAHISILLLSVLILGSILAPFSHYVYMELSDAHQPGSEHGMGMHGSLHPMMEHQHEQAGDHDVTLHTPAAPHPEMCDYAALFATFASVAYVVTTVPLLERAENQLVVTDEVILSSFTALFRSRAPPSQPQSFV